MSQIIQPGQVSFELGHHLPPDYQPAIPHTQTIKTPDGRVIVNTFGGLTVREEIASRILAGISTRGCALSDVDVNVNRALAHADALLARTRPQPETE